MHSRPGLLIPLLLASQALLAQQPLQQAPPAAGGLTESGRPALLTTAPVNQVLPADSAFVLQAFADSENSVLLHWDMQPGYYLYRKSISVSGTDGEALGLSLPSAREITDEYFGAVEVYYDSLDVHATVESPDRTLQLQVEYQGCAEDLYCYPPQLKQIELALP